MSACGAAADGVSLFSLVECGEEEKLVEYLSEEGAQLAVRNSDGRSPLEVAAIVGRETIAKLLVEKGADVNQANKSGYTPLHVCASWGRLGCVRTLVSLGGDARLKTMHGETARDMAERNGQTECAQFLATVEAGRQLSELIATTRDTLADPERISGKWGKDDRNKVNGLCTEKTDWLGRNSLETTVASIEEQREDFEQRLQPYLDKLT